MIWTKDAEHALQNCRIEKKLMTDTNNKFLGKPNMIKKYTGGQREMTLI